MNCETWLLLANHDRFANSHSLLGFHLLRFLKRCNPLIASFNTPDNNIDFEHNPDENFQNDHNIQDDVPNPADDDSAIVMDTVVDVKPKVEEEVQKKVIVKTKKILKGTEATVKVTSEMLNKPSLPDFNDQSYGSFTGPETAIDMSAAMNIDTSAWLKTTEAKEDGTPGEEYVDFYYIDASEVKGVVYLFGKIPIIDKAKNNESRYVFVFRSSYLFCF